MTAMTEEVTGGCAAARAGGRTVPTTDVPAQSPMSGYAFGLLTCISVQSVPSWNLRSPINPRINPR
jgi:hypothetical protein